MRSIFLAAVLLAAGILKAEATVHGVFFYANNCPHCQDVLQQELPPILDRYGDRLQILFVNIETEQGRKVYDEAAEQLHIQRRGVPTLVVGQTVLVGKKGISNRLSELVDEELKKGGVAYPPLPGLVVPRTTAAGLCLASGPAFTTDIAKVMDHEGSLWQRNPVGGALAIALLLFMGYTLLRAARGWWRQGLPERMPSGWRAWVVPLLALFGLGTSLYLTYVDITGSDAICGLTGDCNLVQQSPFAWIFGVLPVAAMGSLGYLAILGFWIYGQLAQQKGELIAGGLSMGIFFGVQFSWYLTFLEPFVIGAICIWCLASALALTALLWLMDERRLPGFLRA